MEAELQEQQDRLTGLVNVLGFTSLDHLEDFVVLHGAARVVPAASIAAAGASLPLDDTQTQTNTLYSATRHAQRNDERRRENRRLRSEVDEVRKELDWLRREHEKHVDELERLRKDKRKLMDEVDSAKAAAAAGPTATATACARTDDAYFEQGIAALVTEAPALYDQIEELEQLLVELEEENTGLVHENHTLEGEKCALETENHAAWSSYDDATATLEQLQQRCDRAEAEMERLKLVEAEFDNLKTQIGTLSAIAARASPAPPQRASSRQPTDPSAIRRNHPLSRSRMSGLAVRTTPLPESKLRSSVPSTSTRLSSQIDPPTPSAATSSRPGANRPTSDSARNQTSSLAQSVDLLDKLPVPAKQSKSSHHTPSTNVTSASAKPTENLWELGCGPSATGILRVSWIQIRQIKQYPMLLSAYTAAVTSFAGPQKWVERILPNLDSSALSSLAPHPLAPGYPSEEFPQFDEPLAFEMTLKTDAHPWIKDGTLEERYEALEDAEKRAVKRLAEWKQWIKVAKPLVQELLAKAGNTSAPQQTNTASIDTPQSTRSLVKKRRRISKEGGDRKPGPSTPNLAGRVVTDNTTIPIARTAITLQGIRAQSRSLAPGPAVNTEETQLPASPERNPIAALDLVSTAKKKKAKWNLLSPKKKCKRETIPDHATFSKEPANVSPAIHGDPRPAASRGDSNPESVLEREPDTLESTEGEPDTLRSSSDAQARSRPPPNSHSPQKIDTPVSSPAKNSPPWSSSTVANDLVEARPRPPFSPSYAAKMHKKAVASSPTVAATTSPRPSPSARAPLQPSPSRRSRSTRSTSSSPRKAGLPMPPSAQPVSRSRETGEDCSNRGLLFGQEGATSPQKTTPKEVEPRSPAGMRIKMEETENNPFLISPVDSNNFMKAASLAEGSKRKSAGNDEQRHSKKAKKSKKIEHDEDLDTDVKPVAYESDSEDNGVLSMGSPDEEGRRLWKKKVRSRLHAKVVEGLQAAKSPQLQVEINPDRNQGQKHAFKQTERKKSVRQTMTAEACGNCQAYYERKKQAVPAGHCNHVHAQDQGSRQKNKKTSNYLYDRADEIDKRMQQDGRHRVAQRTVPDPPDYWQMGFPDTQQIEGINLRAKQQKAELEQYKRIEAEKSNGLYRFRNETS